MSALGESGRAIPMEVGSPFDPKRPVHQAAFMQSAQPAGVQKMLLLALVSWYRLLQNNSEHPFFVETP
jgi:hypothetical protein